MSSLRRYLHQSLRVWTLNFASTGPAWAAAPDGTAAPAAPSVACPPDPTAVGTSSATLSDGDVHEHSWLPKSWPGPASMLPPGAAPGRRTRHRLDRYRFLLLLRFGLINLTGFALLGAAWMQGWIAQILAADDTHICKLIFALFLVGLAWSAQKVWMLSRELNALSRPERRAEQDRELHVPASPARRPHPPGTGRRRCGSSWRTGSHRSARSPARWSCWA